MRITITGALEIDEDRGVIYFHAMDPALPMYLGSILRICSLPIPIPDCAHGNNLDVTHMVGCNWKEKER